MPLFSNDFNNISISTGTPLADIFPTMQNSGVLINTTGNTTVDTGPLGPIGDVVPIGIVGNAAGVYTAMGAQNKSNDPFATTEIDVLSDDADLTGSYVALGISSSTYDNGISTLLPKTTSYVLSVSRALTLGTYTPDDVIVMTGGNFLAENERLRFTGAGDTYFTGPMRTKTVTALDTTGTVSLDPTLGNIFTLVPAGAITLNAASAPAGQQITIIVTTSGTTPYTTTFGTNFKSTGTLVSGVLSGKVLTIQFVSDGTNFNEVCRTTAM